MAGSVAGGVGGQLIFLAKFRPDGAYDASFGGTAGTGSAGSGRVLKDANLTSVTAMTIDAQGRIVVVGETSGTLGQSDFGVVRFNPNGTDDTSFAGDGSTYIGFDLDTAHGRAKDVPTSVTTAPDGSVYVAGRVEDITVPGGFATKRVGVAKLMPDGSNTNTGYGTLPYGRQIFYCNYGCENVASATIVFDVPRNRLVIGGAFYLGDNDSDWFITTQNFGTTPSVQTAPYTIDFGGGSGNELAFMNSLAVQADGKIIALGFAYDVNQDYVSVVLRVHSSSLSGDGSFGNIPGSGIMLIPMTDAVYCDLAIDSSGRIVLAGSFGGFEAGLVTRLMPANGAIDTTFTGNTSPAIYYSRTSNGTSLAYTTFFGRVFLDSGRPVLAGMAPDSPTAPTDFDLIITRLQADPIFTNGFQP